MAFADVILPVALVAGVGFLLGRTRGLDPRPAASVSLYVLSPALTISSLARSSIRADEALGIAAFAVLLAAAVGALALAVARGMGLDGARRTALLLSTLFMNAGNYGMPVVLFALGPEALERAVLFVVIEGVLMYSLGIAIAAQGRSGTGFDLRRAVRAMAGQPAFYAGAAGLVLRGGIDRAPVWLLRPLDMLSQAAIPMILLLLGLQLARVKPAPHSLRDVALAGFLRLLASPLLATALVILLGLPELTARVLIIEAAMPSAVVATLLAVEYDALPEVVSATTMATTLASLVTVSVVLSLLT